MISKLLFTFVLATSLLARGELPALPRPATSFGAATSDGRLYLYGGNTGKAHEFHRDCVKGDFFALPLAEGGAWEPLPGGEALLSPALVASHGTLIRLGGMTARNAPGEKNDLHSTADVQRFDPKTGAWSTLPALPAPRSSHDAAILGETLYVGGGWKLDGASPGEWCATLLTLDLTHPEAGWHERPQPFQRRALAMAAQGGRLWFIGGMDRADEPSREVDWYEPATGQWGKGPLIPESPMAGFGIAACAQAGRLCISPLSGVVFALAVDGSAWQEIARLHEPRFFHRLLPLEGGRLLAVGGSNRTGQIAALETLTPGSGTWSQWRGPQRDGTTTETLPPHPAPKLLWEAAAGVGMSSPVVAEEKVILHGNDGEGTDTVRALSTATGEEKWHYSFPAAAVAHEMPIVPNGPGATPTIAGGRVFALSRDGTLLCLRLADGALVWRANLVTDLGGKRPVYGYTQSPLVAEGRVLVDLGGDAGSTAALEAATGTVLWRSGKGEAGYSSARLFTREGRQLAAFFKGEALEVLDPASGETIWSYRTTARDFTNAATPVFVGHQILVTNTGSEPAALLDWDAGTKPNVRTVWTHRQFAQLFNTAILHQGCLFAFNEKRRGQPEFTCVDAVTGENKWVSDAVPTGTFVLAGAEWLFLTREGEVVIASATSEGLKPATRFAALEGKCYATPALHQGRLFVRSNAGVVKAFQL